MRRTTRLYSWLIPILHICLRKCEASDTRPSTDYTDSSFDSRNPADGKPTTEAKDTIWSLLLEWAENENDGLVPNPYQYGVGEKTPVEIVPTNDTKPHSPLGFDGWEKWSQIWSFWGYDENNASRKPHP